MSKYAGLDWSMSSPGLAIQSENEVLFYGIKQKKKHVSSNKNIVLLDPVAVYKNDAERYFLLSAMFIEILKEHKITTVFLEGYAYGASGNTFNIGECTGILKLSLWKSGIDLIVLQPGEIKKFATGKGNANKTAMYDAYIAQTGHDFAADINDERRGDKIPSPVNDLVDAFFILGCGLSKIRS